jgi:Uma2 family endonuclease
MINGALLFPASFAEQIMVMPVVDRRWTAREVRELIARSPKYAPRYELVDGELLVTPSPAFLHQRAVTRLVVALGEYLQREPIAEVLASPSDVELEPEFIRQPDVYIVSPAEARRLSRDGLPIRELLVAIEVLSPSSSRHDRVRKRPMYQRHVPEYWIVDLDARLIERWRPLDERPEVITRVLEWNPGESSSGLRLDLVQFFTRILDS